MPDFQTFNDEQKESLREGGKILRGCLDLCASSVKPGITTKQLDTIAEEFIRSHNGAVPAFLGYNNFPGTLCTSTNDECVHGLPSDRELKEGDIISVDCGVLLDNLYTDACVTVPVGNISSDAQKLLDVTKGALDEVVKMLKAGIHTGDISNLIQTFAEEAGFKPVKALTGHGLGSTLHQFPDIPNLGNAGDGPVLIPNTLIAIEPIISAGADYVKEAPDKWTLSIADGDLSAHFEHSLLILDETCEIIA